MRFARPPHFFSIGNDDSSQNRNALFQHRLVTVRGRYTVDVTTWSFQHYTVYCQIMLCHVMSCHVMSCHIMSCPVISCHVLSYHIMSCHIISCHAMFIVNIGIDDIILQWEDVVISSRFHHKTFFFFFQ